MGQFLVKPHLLRDVNGEFDVFNMEEASVRRKLAVTNGDQKESKQYYSAIYPTSTTDATAKTTSNHIHLQEYKYESTHLYERLREIEADKIELGELFRHKFPNNDLRTD